MAVFDEILKERLEAGRQALEQGLCETAIELFSAALRYRPLSPDQEANIRFQLNEAYDAIGRNKEAKAAIAKYEQAAARDELRPSSLARIYIAMGRVASRAGDQQKAIGYLNSALKLGEEYEDKLIVGLSYLGLCRAYRLMGEFEIAIDYAEKALEHFRARGERRLLAWAYRQLAGTITVEGEYEKALNYYEQAEKLILEKPDFLLLGGIYQDRAAIKVLQKEIAAAVPFFYRAIDCFKKVPHKRHLGRTYCSLGLNLIWIGDAQAAQQALDQAMEISSEINDKVIEGSTLDNLGLLYLLQGEYKEAEQCLLRSIELLSSSTSKYDKWPEAQARQTLTRLYLRMGDAQQALQAAEEYLKTSRETGDSQFVLGARLLVAEALELRGDLDAAEEIVESLRDELSDRQNLSVAGEESRLLGRIQLKRGRMAEAINCIAQSISIFETLKDDYQVGLSALEMGEVLAAIGEKDQATEQVNLAREIFTRIGAAVDCARADQMLNRIEGPELPAPAFEDRKIKLDSIADDLITERLLDGAVSRELLLNELAAIARQLTQSQMAIIFGKSSESGPPTPIAVKGCAREAAENIGKEIAETIGRKGNQAVSDLIFYLTVRHPETEEFALFLSGFPVGPSEVARRLKAVLRLAEHSLELCALRGRVKLVKTFDPGQMRFTSALPGFIYASPAMKHILEQIHRIRSSDVTVLITGESGTGKELIARAIHAESARRDNIFLPFNCTATTKDLIDSQLFGYRKGAFTGAAGDYPGIIRSAEGGTLFLDEVGDLTLEVQPKLLRFLQEGEVQPIGEKHPVKVDVRVIAATNSDLEQKVAEGAFREDLFHRLNVIRLHVPPLRERPEEIPLFLAHFLDQFSKSFGKRDLKIAQEAMDLMMVYHWPGNVRQLSNEVRRVVAMAESKGVITADALSEEIVGSARKAAKAMKAGVQAGEQQSDKLVIDTSQKLADAVNQVEKMMLLEALKRNAGNVSRAARELGLTRRGFHLKRERLGLFGMEDTLTDEDESFADNLKSQLYR